MHHNFWGGRQYESSIYARQLKTNLHTYGMSSRIASVMMQSLKGRNIKTTVSRFEKYEFTIQDKVLSNIRYCISTIPYTMNDNTMSKLMPVKKDIIAIRYNIHSLCQNSRTMSCLIDAGCISTMHLLYLFTSKTYTPSIMYAIYFNWIHIQAIPSITPS